MRIIRVPDYHLAESSSSNPYEWALRQALKLHGHVVNIKQTMT